MVEEPAGLGVGLPPGGAQLCGALPARGGTGSGRGRVSPASPGHVLSPGASCSVGSAAPTHRVGNVALWRQDERNGQCLVC